MAGRQAMRNVQEYEQQKTGEQSCIIIQARSYCISLSLLPFPRALVSSDSVCQWVFLCTGASGLCAAVSTPALPQPRESVPTGTADAEGQQRGTNSGWLATAARNVPGLFSGRRTAVVESNLVPDP